MRTQSIDTSPEAERFLIALLRQNGVAKRFRLTASLSRSAMIGGPLARQQQQPGLTEQEALLSSFRYSLGQALMDELRQVAEQRQILPTYSTVELEAAFVPVIQALEHMGIACALTGSLARSLHGMQRALFQVDILADLENVDATFLQELLPAAFYIRPRDIHAALAHKTSVIYYHLPSLFHIQVAFPRMRLDETSMLKRARCLTVIDGKTDLPVLIPEDISVLALVEIQQEKAELVRQGRKEEPDDLWNELLGVLKVQAPELDIQFIEQQTRHLALRASLMRAFEDAGLKE